MQEDYFFSPACFKIACSNPFPNALPMIWWFTVFQAMKQAYKINKMS